MSLLIETSQTNVGEFNWKKRLAAEMNDVSRWAVRIGPVSMRELDSGESVFRALEVRVEWTLSSAAYKWIKEHCDGYPIRLLHEYGGLGVNGPHFLPLIPTEYEWNDATHIISFKTYMTRMSFLDVMERKNIILPQQLGIVLTVAIAPHSDEFPPIMPASQTWSESHANEYIDPTSGGLCSSIPAGGGPLLYKYRIRMRCAPDEIDAFDSSCPAVVTILPQEHCGHWVRRQDFRQWHNYIYDSQH